MDSSDSVPEPVWTTLDALSRVPLWVWAASAVLGLSGILVLAYASLLIFAPVPRPPKQAEQRYITILPDGSVSKPQSLPCWHNGYLALKEMARNGRLKQEDAYKMQAGDVFMSLVVPAYNEEQRLSGMLEEAVEYLEANYGHHGTRSKSSTNADMQASGQQGDPWRGWEIIVVSDGSTDGTVETALNFARTHQLNEHAAPNGPWNGTLKHGKIVPGAIRVVQLEENRGKGGAVTHGMRHARGTYVVFADADGASRFEDLGKLVSDCARAKDAQGRAVGIGSRAHMVGTEAVVKRSFLRNALMRAFHLLIRTLTTAQTGAIKDTQCGFKLFTRPALPYIIPYMHTEGWIFDVEMLMLAESAQIPMVEVAVGWKEVKGSKLNVVKDSLGMAIGLAILRIGWGLGFYKKD